MQKTVPLESVIRKNEDIYWKGHPEKLPFIFNDIKYYLPELLLRLIFDIILCPILIIKYQPFNFMITFILFVLWIFHCMKCFELISRPLTRLNEWKNIYYIITNNHIYIQFGSGEQIYYRMYPIDRIGTKVFYRKNYIDSIFNVGTIGISVDDYYEERLISISGFEDVYQIFKGYTKTRQEQNIEKHQQEMLQEEKEYQEKLQKLEQEKEAELKRQEEIKRLNEEHEAAAISNANEIERDEHFETYEEYKQRSMAVIQESRREEMRKEDAKKRAEEARRRHEMRQAEAAAQKKQEQKINDEDIMETNAIEEMMNMQEEHLNNTRRPNPTVPQSANTPPRKNKKKPGYKFDDKTRRSKQQNTIPKSKIKNDGNEKAKAPEPVSDEEIENLDLSVFWKKK